MSTLFDSLRTKDTYTENGALSNSTTLNDCLDFFSVAGNHFDASDAFFKAFNADPQLAMRILFWSRDCRGGAGSRKCFIEVMKTLQANYKETFSKVYKFIPEFGYWKDIYKLACTPELVSFIAETLKNDHDHSLCAKYCPRKGEWFYMLRKEFNMTPSDFRHFIVSKTQVIENYMCANKWEDVNYSEVPSVAMKNYTRVFNNHDRERFAAYLKSVLKGEAKVNSSVLYPSDLYEKFHHALLDEYDSIRAQWNNLPDYMADSTERILPICDVSGSMIGTPMNVSVALGCYISERNKSIFKDGFITFSEHPRLQYLQGDDIISRFKQLQSADWGMNTNLEAVFKLILNRAVENNLTEDDMPTKLLIISDMQFDACSNDGTNFDNIKRLYNNAGYKIPGIIFWNVRGRVGDVPVTTKDLDVALVSGYSPSILISVLQAKVLRPVELMLATVNAERYSCIVL